MNSKNRHIAISATALLLLMSAVLLAPPLSSSSPENNLSLRVLDEQCLHGLCLQDELLYLGNSQEGRDQLVTLEAFLEGGHVRTVEGEVVSLEFLRPALKEKACLSNGSKEELCLGDYIFTKASASGEFVKARVLQIFPRKRLLLEINYDQVDSEKVLRRFHSSKATDTFACIQHPKGSFLKRIFARFFGENSSSDSETLPAR